MARAKRIMAREWRRGRGCKGGWRRKVVGAKPPRGARVRTGRVAPGGGGGKERYAASRDRANQGGARGGVGRSEHLERSSRAIRGPLAHEQFGAERIEHDKQAFGRVFAFEGSARDKRIGGDAVDGTRPRERERARGGEADANAGETAGADIDDDALGLAAILGEQFGDHGDQPFGMAASDHLVAVRDDSSSVQQRDGAGGVRGFDGEDQTARTSVTSGT